MASKMNDVAKFQIQFQIKHNQTSGPPLLSETPKEEQSIIMIIAFHTVSYPRARYQARVRNACHDPQTLLKYSCKE
jgi:hypothetical protein